MNMQAINHIVKNAYFTGSQPVFSKVSNIQNSTSSALSSLQKETIKKYDFTNITPKELRDTVNGLIVNGQMTLDEAAPLVMMMTKDTNPLNDSARPNATINVMNELQEGIKGDLSRNEIQSSELKQITINALLRFQGKPSSINALA